MASRALGPRMAQLLAFIHAYYFEHDGPPSYATMRDELGFCDNATVRQHLKRLERAGEVSLIGEYVGGRQPRRGQRIRLGRPDEVQRVAIKMGRDL